MATERIALVEQLGKSAHSGDVDFLRQAVKAMAESLMELEAGDRRDGRGKRRLATPGDLRHRSHRRRQDPRRDARCRSLRDGRSLRRPRRRVASGAA